MEEIDPWEEDGETWRWLKAIFPVHIASQTRQQVSYFGPDGLMRRHDYNVDVPGGSLVSTMLGTAGSLTALWRRRVPHHAHHVEGASNERHEKTSVPSTGLRCII